MRREFAGFNIGVEIPPALRLPAPMLDSGPVMIKSKVLSYEGEAATIRYDVARCIHAARCSHGLPQVFDPKRKPWVAPDEASADELAEVVARCPSGALTLERKDGGPAEAPPPVNRITAEENGPVHLTGELRLETLDGEPLAGARSPETRLSLCRCGLSENKPLCDNSHIAAAFEAPAGSGKPAGDPREEDASGPLHVRPAPNGPVLLEGPFELDGADADAFRGEKGALCRCGLSGNKPWCDGSHSTGGFRAD